PYTWEVENATLANTTNDGYLTAVSGGNTHLLVKDVNGAKGSCTLSIFDTWVSVRDSNTAVSQQTITIPLNLGTLPSGKGIFALSGKVTSSFSKIDSIQVNTLGTLTQNWQLANKNGKNQTNFALSGTTAITNGGKILNIKIYFNSTILVGDAFYLNCTDLLLNEGSPNVKVNSGYISINNVPTKINETQKNDVSIFPVPVKDNLIVSLTPDYSSSVISVLDLSGKTILSTTLNNYQEKQFLLPVESLSEGFYILKLQNAKQSIVLKFTKN
ncbi:MAG: T9SS type A sorting domain-containing protein, partial [Paludibacter sp.]|nr:T9SS type A sorting domain-containing protein [Paludibacter sp.]